MISHICNGWEADATRRFSEIYTVKDDISMVGLNNLIFVLFCLGLEDLEDLDLPCLTH